MNEKTASGSKEVTESLRRLNQVLEKYKLVDGILDTVWKNYNSYLELGTALHETRLTYINKLREEIKELRKEAGL